MKARLSLRPFAILMSLLLAALACTAGANPGNPGESPTQALPSPTADLVSPSATAPPGTLPPTQALPTDSLPTVQGTDTPTPGPTCTALQDLNVRSGPGRAYDPPINSLLANTAVTPLGYNPNGVPGGPWIYIEDPAGWVSAGEDFVSCNISLTALPFKAADAPPPRPSLPHSVTSSTPEGGTCGPGLPYDCNVIVSDDSLIKFVLLRDGQELGPDDGVQEVDFQVMTLDKTRTIYSKAEANPAYCIFGGNGPCNPWVLEDGIYKWTPGGEPVQEGRYIVNIDPLFDPALIEDQVHWEAYLDISLP